MKAIYSEVPLYFPVRFYIIGVLSFRKGSGA